MHQCYAALPYLIDFEAGRSFREALANCFEQYLSSSRPQTECFDCRNSAIVGKHHSWREKVQRIQQVSRGMSFAISSTEFDFPSLLGNSASYGSAGWFDSRMHALQD